MREFDDSKMKLPFSLGDAANRMWQELHLDPEPVRYLWKDVELVMRKLPSK